MAILQPMTADILQFVPSLGMINPNMGAMQGCDMDKQTGLGDALFSTTQIGRAHV